MSTVKYRRARFILAVRFVRLFATFPLNGMSAFGYNFGYLQSKFVDSKRYLDTNSFRLLTLTLQGPHGSLQIFVQLCSQSNLRLQGRLH